jgi:voltage-gated potassium channel
MTYRKTAYLWLEKDFTSSRGTRVLSSFIVLLIVANVTAIILESYAPIGEKYQQAFSYFNVFSVVVFTVEYVARVWAAVEAPLADQSKSLSTRIRYILSPVALIDLMAILPFYLSFLVAIDLRYLRLLRMLRLLKLAHYFKGLRLFLDVLYREATAIGAAILMVMVLIILSASIMYTIEHQAQPEAFQSIPHAIWWAVVTMTTVGYGDVTPVTFLGKFIAIFIMLLGVAVVALPAAMLATKFGDELRLRKRRLEVGVSAALHDGIVNIQERKELDELADKLDISTHTLEGLIETRALEQVKTLTCPNCNQTILSKEVTKS